MAFSNVAVVHVDAEGAERDVTFVLLRGGRFPAPEGRKVGKALEVVVVRVPVIGERKEIEKSENGI